MRYEMISADCHVDLCWLPPDLFPSNASGSAGREYVPGKIRRSDCMASTGLYEGGKRGIRRLTRGQALTS